VIVVLNASDAPRDVHVLLAADAPSIWNGVAA